MAGLALGSQSLFSRRTWKRWRVGRQLEGQQDRAGCLYGKAGSGGEGPKATSRDGTSDEVTLLARLGPLMEALSAVNGPPRGDARSTARSQHLTATSPGVEHGRTAEWVAYTGGFPVGDEWPGLGRVLLHGDAGIRFVMQTDRPTPTRLGTSGFFLPYVAIHLPA